MKADRQAPSPMSGGARSEALASAGFCMSPLGITLLMLAGFAGFGWLAWRKLAIVVRLQPEVRWDHPAARLQGRARQRLPAAAHDRAATGSRG